MNQLDEFIHLFKEQYIDGSQFEMQPDTIFRQIESWDSLTGMAVLVMIQDKYGIDIPIDDFKKLITLQDTYNYIVKLTKHK